MKYVFWFLIYSFVFCCKSDAQLPAKSQLQQIVGLPTKEVYDLMVDKKGFMWVGHELGLAKYNGLTFSNYTNAEQVSLGMTNLIEDSAERVWCCNFSGQIFYVDNEKMHFLNAYDYAKETGFPTLVLMGNKLFATSKNGLFVVNTINKQCKYINKSSNGELLPNSKSLVSNTKGLIILTEENKWYLYNEKLKSVLLLKVDNLLSKINFSKLYSNNNCDTFFAVSQNNEKVYKLVYFKNKISLVGFLPVNGKLQSLSITPQSELWINSNLESKNKNNSAIIKGKSINDVVVDSENNYWFSSVTNGVLFQPKNEIWNIEKDKSIGIEDYHKYFAVVNNYLVQGSFKGNILVKNLTSGVTTQVYRLSSNMGFIERIIPRNERCFLIITSSAILQLDVIDKKITPYINDFIARDIYTDKNYVLIASNSGVYILPNQPVIADSVLKNTKQLNYSVINNKVSALFNQSIYRTNGHLHNVPAFFDTKQPARSICYNEKTKTIYAAYKMGLHTINSKGIEPIYYNNIPIYATSVTYAKGKVIAATMSSGIFIIDENGIRNITIQNGLTSNTVLKIKLQNNHIWVLGCGLVQVLNVDTEKIISKIHLPKIIGNEIFDVLEIDNKAYFTTKDGMYGVPLIQLPEKHFPSNYLLFATVDNKDTLPINNAVLLYNKNNIQFHIASLWYTNPMGLHMRYRLMGSNDESWKTTIGPQNLIAFTSLNAGKYKFEAIAVNDQGIEAQNYIRYSFAIPIPWWQQWYLYLLVAALLLFTFYFIVQQRINTINKRNVLVVEKIQLESELRSSMLTAMKSQMNPHFIFNALNTIQSYIYTNDKQKASSYLGKFSNLIRIILATSNKKSISLSEEIETLQLYVDLEEMRFEDNFLVEIMVDSSLNKDAILIPPMLVQPYVENAIKHGLLHKEEQRVLKISFRNASAKNALHIIIEDNGIGRKQSGILNSRKNNGLGFATTATEKRIDILNQSLHHKIDIQIIDKKSNNGQAIGTIVHLTLPNELLVYH